MPSTSHPPRGTRPPPTLARLRAKAPVYLTYVRERPAWAVFMLLGRFLLARRLERRLRRAPPARIAPPDASRITLQAPPAEVMSRLLRDGVVEGLRLSPDDIAEILAFAHATPCCEREAGRPGFLPSDLAAVNAARDRDIVAAYYFEAVQSCPAITRLAADSLLLHVADRYLGRPAQLIRTRLWWSFPGRRIDAGDLHAAAQDCFHFDMNDWRTLKFFFYLTPATSRSGAHRYIPGSHRRRKLAHQFTLTVGHNAQDVLDYYGADAVRTVTGQAGDGFAEDPFVFHTGARCLDAPRLMLELEYGSAAPSPSYRFGVRV